MASEIEEIQDQTQSPTQNVTNFYVQQPQRQKSMAVAFLLTFFFGPLGMLYSTVAGALIMLVVSVVLGFLTAGLSLFVTWPICIIWAMMAARN